MKTRHILLLILCVTVLTGCPRAIIKQSSNTVVKPSFRLHVAGNSGKLQIIDASGNGRCQPSSTTDGCVLVANRDTALISFELKNNSASTYYFTEFIICPGGTKDTVCTLEPWQQAEFFASIGSGTQILHPDDEGKIDLTQLSSNLTRFYIFDYNSVEQEFFYSIKACDSANPTSCSVTDPPIDNKGRN